MADIIVTLRPRTTLHQMLVEMQYALQSHYRGSITKFERSCEDMEETFGVSPAQEDGSQIYYVVSHTSLPTDVYAEIEDGTYGELQGWRIYV